LGNDWIKVFGPETADASDHAGALSFSDARLLLLPVRSVAGTFAWVTSPYLLAVFAREAKLAGIAQMPTIPALKEQECLVTAATLLKADLGGKSKVVLEEFDLDAKSEADKSGADPIANYLAPLVFMDKEWQDLLKKRICIVHDDTMSFLAEHGTEVVTRVCIDPTTGTAKQGQLWTEENLPAESVLVSLVEQHTTTKTRGNPGQWLDLVQKQLLSTPIQLGGKATVGRGRCALHLVQGGK
jgi:CRISPR-associated protein Cmr4